MDPLNDLRFVTRLINLGGPKTHGHRTQLSQAMVRLEAIVRASTGPDSSKELEALKALLETKDNKIAALEFDAVGTDEQVLALKAELKETRKSLGLAKAKSTRLEKKLNEND